MKINLYLSKIGPIAFFYPAILLVLGFIPGVNRLLYSIHSSIGWLLLSLSFTWVVVTLFFVRLKQFNLSDRWKHACISLLGYGIVTLPIAYIFQKFLVITADLKLQPHVVWDTLMFPISLLWN